MRRGNVEPLNIQFSGWFMCRLPTDPDPTDERRGVSGSTFAYGDEPDLDRIIRLHAPPELVRSHCPAIGVYVNQATLGDQGLDVMSRASVNLLDDPRFENRNFVLTMAGKEPIVPFHIEVLAGLFYMRRKVHIDPANPRTPISKIPRMALQRYGARGFYTATEKVLAATGIPNPLQSRVERRARLLSDLEEQRDPLRREVLRRRIRELEIAIHEQKNERLVVMRAIEEFSFTMNGDAEISHHLPFPGRVMVEEPWSIDFWMGGWDPDAMSGYMSGALKIPVEVGPS